MKPTSKTNGLIETDALNALQSAGIISDNAVTAADVSQADCATAIHFLKRQNHDEAKS